MRLETFQNFIAIVECGTITAAARQMRIAQPALSNQIRMLEEEFGVQLLKRSTRWVELTEAGQVLYARCKTICRLEADLRRELHDSAQNGSGTLRLGISQTLPQKFTERILRLCNQDAPGLRYILYTDTAGDVAAMVRDGFVDIGVADLHHPSPPGLDEVLSVPEYPHVVFLSDNMWLPANRASICIADLRDIPLCVTHRDSDVISQLCMDEGFIPVLRCVSDNLPQLHFWTEQGLAVTVLYLSRTDDLPRELNRKPLIVHQNPSNRVFLAKKNQPLNASSHLFIRFAHQLYSSSQT